MRKKISTAALAFLFFMMVMGQSIVLAGDSTVITLGADLSQDQKEMILNKFGVPQDVEHLTVTNEEQLEALGEYLSPTVIGKRAYSSAKVVPAQKDSGIGVSVDENINWVTEEMYINALVTAGVEDAEVTIAAPFPVSGTAALTGIIKAFESAKGVKLSEKQVDAANEELVKMSTLGKKIGDPQKASQLVSELKNQLGQLNPKTDNDYRSLINKVAKDMGIDLTEDQINSLMDLLKKLKSLDVDWKQLAKQAANIHGKFSEIMEENPEVRSLWGQVVDFFKNIFDIVLQLFK